MIRDGRNSTNHSDENRKARDAALRLLGLCDRSKKDLIERLLRKGYSGAAAEKAADEMESLGYIDDRRYAERFASDAVKRKDAGLQMVISGLQKKGIARDIIDEVSGRIFNEYKETDIARKALSRRIKKGDAQMDRAEIKRLSDYLRRKGFSYDIIKDVLKGIRQDDDIC